jgi:VanZ family protein
MIARGLACAGAVTILVLSFVPADERPVTGLGQAVEHLTAFGLVAAVFAINGYRLGLIRLLVIAFLFCGCIELLQIPLPTRDAPLSDFALDLLGSYVAIRS